MTTQHRGITTLLALATLAWTAGCGTPADTKDAKKDAGGGRHAHASHGPHEGDLIELGDEEYHAELVHDETANTVTIYVLDSTAKKAVAIPAKEVKIALKHDGNAEEFVLTADPQDDDAEGKSSRFVSKEAELGEDLEHEGADPRLLIEIDGTQFNGKIEHAHEHDG